MGETIFQHTENHSKNPCSQESMLEIYDGFDESMCSLSENHKVSERVEIVLSSQGPIIK